MSSLLITGATGLAGSGILRYCITDNSITKITALTRSPLPDDLLHPKVQVVLHKDFADYSNISEQLKGHDMCFWCLGISQTKVTKEQYKTITNHYAVEGMKAMCAANENMLAFCFLSGRGADTNENAWTLFGTVKGKTENDLKKLNDRVWSFRPGFIYNPLPPKENPGSIASRMLYPMMPFALRHTSTMGSSVEEIAQAMIHVGRYGHDAFILENADIRAVANIHST
eukprot:Phypoly_transcript_15887.p1 GENE.Phypoly_transcript_15887~~Phypoly_transcript_15887.p1  ORF type:complete len:227 (+),score=15.00 Phypoly_transcript_15887:185-865(+)